MGDQVSVVRKSGLSQSTRHCMVICPIVEQQSCHQRCFFVDFETKYSWSTDFHLVASLENLIRCFQSNLSLTGFAIPTESKIELFAVSFPALWNVLELSTIGDRLRDFDTRFRASFDFATTRSFSCFSFLHQAF